MSEPYKQPAVPASIVTQLKMLDSTIDDAEQKRAQAINDRKAVVNTFYADLIGKTVAYAEKQYRRTMTYRVKIDGVHVDDDGTIRYIVGYTVRKDGQRGLMRKDIRKSDIEDGRMTVVDDA